MGKGAAASATQSLGDKDPLHFKDAASKDASKIQDPILKLNAWAQEIAMKHPEIEEFKLLKKKPSGFWESPEVCIALGLANPTVYVRRWEWFAALHAAVAVAFIANFIINEPNGLMKYAATLLAMWWWSDFKGGMLHVVLDTPGNIKYPVIGLPSLEFQLHHAIPQDIVMKGFGQACADLNPIACYAFLILSLQTWWDPYSMALGETILLCSYAGQYSHQATHKLAKHRPEWVKMLQNVGILLPPDVHRRHHQTHDKDFAILNGWSNPLLKQMLKIFPQKECAGVWVGMFLMCTAFDAWSLSMIMKPLLGVVV